MNKRYSILLLVIFGLWKPELFAQPAAPQLIEPTNNAENVPTSLTFRWSSVSNADTYNIQIATDQNFNDIVYDDNTAATSIDLSGFSRNTQFFWRVRAGTNTLLVTQYGDWSEVWNFTTIPSPPAAPVLVSPENGETSVSTNPTLDWNEAPRGEIYHLQLSTDSGFNSLVVNNNGINATELEVNGLNYNTKYFWRVRASNAGGDSDWSTIRNFTTVVQPPATPELVSPGDGATAISTDPSLDWNASQGAETYRVQLATDPGFNSLVVDNSGLSSTGFQVKDLENGTEYFWRVQASNAGGDSDWTTGRNFTTIIQAPATPGLVSPENGATSVSTNPDLNWNSSQRAETYWVQIATDSGFNSLVVDNSDISSTEFQAEGLDTGTEYFWRVRAANAGGESNWSASRSFTTMVNAPATPELVSPGDGATGVAVDPILDWNQASRADSYHLQLAADSDFNSMIVDNSDLNATEFQVEGLDHDTKYFWRVRAVNAGGESNWSASWSFTTAKNPPASPDLVSPENGATGVPKNPVIDWDSSAGAETYDLQVATDDEFQSIVVHLRDVPSTQYQQGLKGYTKYFWRVRARNNQGNSSWSDEWSFTTEKTDSSITILTPDTQSFWKASNTYTIQWEVTNQINNVVIEYSMDSGESWNLIADQIPSDKSFYGWEVPDISSTQIQIKVSDQSGSGVFDISEPFVIYPSTVTLEHEFKFPSSSSATDYRLIGLPADESIPIQQLIPGEPGRDWNAYYDNGNPNNFLVEFDGSGQFTFSAGTGFWIISKKDFSVETKVQAVGLAEDTTYSIPLHDGWNIISNPYNQPVSWQQVQKANNISDPIWAFRENFEKSTIVELYKGYYFFNRDSLSELTIPYPDVAISNSKNSAGKVQAAGSMELSVMVDEKKLSEINIGLDPEIWGEHGITWHYAPPAPFQKYQLTIDSKVQNHKKYPLAEINLNKIDRIERFSLLLTAVPNRQVRLKIDGQEIFKTKALKLVDMTTGQNWDLHRKGPVYLKPDQKQTRYELLIGQPVAVEEEIGQIIPAKATLVQNYPNPFNPKTTIAFSIPEVTDVELKVYNITGRLIKTLVNERMNAGYYKIPFNGINLASGVYLYRLKVGQTVTTKKMILLK